MEMIFSHSTAHPGVFMKTMRLLLSLSLIFFISACGAQPSLRLNKNGSGRFDLTLRLEKPFVDYLLDLGEITGTITSRDRAVIFDLATIEKKLKQYPGVKITSLAATPDGELSLSLTFTHVSVFASPGTLWPKGSPLAYSTGSPASLRLRLDKEIMNRILTAFFNFKATELENFLPRAGESRKEYEGGLNFALDGGADLFRNSSINFQITVDGEILDHNGTLKNNNTVEFNVPLGTVLFLEKPIEYYIIYK
jgi:hypothetical protein